MAVAIAQVADAATGGTKASNLTTNFGGTPTSGDDCIAVVVWDLNPDNAGGNDVGITASANMRIQAQVAAGKLGLALFRLVGNATTAQAIEAFFDRPTYASMYSIDASGVGSVIATLLGYTIFGTNSVTGDTPLTWAPQTGDLPYGFFGARDASTVAAQAGWTEVDNLNSTTGEFAQLEVQQGPATVSTPQNVTAEATWSGTPSDTHNIAALVILSGAGPYALSSQEPLEVLGLDTANARVSQEPLEALGIDTSHARVSQDPVEVVALDTSLAHVSQVVLEAVIPLYVRSSQEPMEVLALDTAHARVSQVVTEVLWSSQGARRRVVDDEWFMY